MPLWYSENMPNASSQGMGSEQAAVLGTRRKFSCSSCPHYCGPWPPFLFLFAFLPSTAADYLESMRVFGGVLAGLPVIKFSFVALSLVLH